MSANPGLHLAGALLLAGGIIFNVGAFSPPWEQWRAPLPRALEVIGQHRVAWNWIHGCFAVGVIVTILGFSALASALRGSTGSPLAELTSTAYLAGAVLWLASIAFRLTVQSWAAGEVLRTGAIPPGYEALHRYSNLLFGIYMALGYLACAGMGWTMLQTGHVARWAGWFSIAFGLSGGAVVGVNVPLMVHIPPMIVGVLLLRS